MKLSPTSGESNLQTLYQNKNMHKEEEHESYDDDDRLEGEAVSTPALIFQTSGMPDNGIDVEGDVLFSDLGIESDDRFNLDDAKVHFRLHISAAKMDVIAIGKLDAEAEAICDRCAEYAPLNLSTDDVFHTFKNGLGQPIDLTEGIREDILLTFPQSFHCSEDCKGLCPVCGQNLNVGQCSCELQSDDDSEDGNPWSALDGLEFK